MVYANWQKEIVATINHSPNMINNDAFEVYRVHMQAESFCSPLESQITYKMFF